MSGKKRVTSKKVARNKNSNIENVFAELQIPGSDELLTRAMLLNNVSSLIKESGLSQKEVAEKLGITQPKVSLLVGGRLSAFSTDTLLSYLSTLGCDIKISVKKPRSRRAIFGKKGSLGVS